MLPSQVSRCDLSAQRQIKEYVSRLVKLNFYRTTNHHHLMIERQEDYLYLRGKIGVKQQPIGNLEENSLY